MCLCYTVIMARDFNNLKRWMLPKIDKLGITIEDFGNKAGVGRCSLYRYFSDKARPTEQVMVRICRVLGVPFEEGLRQYTPKPNGRPKGSGGGTAGVRVRQR